MGATACPAKPKANRAGRACADTNPETRIPKGGASPSMPSVPWPGLAFSFQFFLSGTPQMAKAEPLVGLRGPRSWCFVIRACWVDADHRRSAATKRRQPVGTEAILSSSFSWHRKLPRTSGRSDADHAVAAGSGDLRPVPGDGGTAWPAAVDCTRAAFGKRHQPLASVI